jgi:hypothetical protein
MGAAVELFEAKLTLAREKLLDDARLIFIGSVVARPAPK